MKSTFVALAAAGCLLASQAFAQNALTPSPINPLTPVTEDFFGNTNVVGSKGCGAVQGTFPIKTILYEYNGLTTYYLQILIQNPPIGLPLQYLTAVVGPSTGYNVFDPDLFGTSALVPGTYTGAVTLSGNVLSLGTTAAPLVLTQTVASTNTSPCVLSLTGQLLFSP
jgi:hypothetical protein